MIAVLFSCKLCGLEDAECKVRARESGEDVVKWMQYVTREVSLAHGRKSLFCNPKTLSEVKIPIDKDDPEAWIGKQPEDKRC